MNLTILRVLGFVTLCGGLAAAAPKPKIVRSISDDHGCPDYRFTESKDEVSAWPAEGASGILRLDLPANNQSVRLDGIDLEPFRRKLQRSDF